MVYQNTESEDTRVQARGVWHRPNVTNEETSLEGICSVLDKFQYAGINLIFLEVFYHGMTVFKTPTVEYYTGFENYDYGIYPDYLSAFTAEAEKRNIEVHAWVEDFYIGVKANRFVNNCPQWLLLNSKGEYRQSEGADYGGYIFLDPANPEVRTFLTNFYSEMLTKFPSIKGLNLDYIRYPVSSQSDDTGFTKSAMEQFAAFKGWELPDDKISTFINKINSTGTYSQFTDFRAAQVTAFVEGVHNMIKQDHPKVILSTAIFPEASLSYNQKKQDFTAWLKNGYLDVVTPMAYYDDNNTLKNALNGMLKDCSDSFCYVGLSSTYHSLSNDQVLQQIAVCDGSGADGFVFFGSQSILKNDAYVELLHSVYGSTDERDVTPHGSISRLVSIMSDSIIEKLTVKSADGEEDQYKIDLLKAELDDIADLGEDSQWALDEAENKLKLLCKYNLEEYVSPSNSDWVRSELELLYRYACVHAERARVKQYLPAEPPEMGASTDTGSDDTAETDNTDLTETDNTDSTESDITGSSETDVIGSTESDSTDTSEGEVEITGESEHPIPEQSTRPAPDATENDHSDIRDVALGAIAISAIALAIGIGAAAAATLSLGAVVVMAIVLFKTAKRKKI